MATRKKRIEYVITSTLYEATKIAYVKAWVEAATYFNTDAPLHAIEAMGRNNFEIWWGRNKAENA